MKLLEEVGIRFLIGIFIAALIGFLFWYLVAHNATDRTVERSFQKFYKSIDEACQKRATKDNPVEVYIEIPQRRFENILQESWRNIVDFIKSKTGIGGPSLPFTTFGDPYYKFYWEIFPPEPPYELSDIAEGDVAGFLMAFFLPWSEDLPWSSNLILSMALATAFGGIDFFKVSSLKNVLSKGFSTFKWEVARRFEKLASRLEDIKVLARAVEGLETFVQKTKDFVIEIKEFVITVKDKAGNVLKELKFGAKTTLMYTGICLLTSDENLEDCLVYGALGGALTVRSKVFIQQYALPKIKSRIETYYNLLKFNIKSALQEVKDYAKKEIQSFRNIVKNIFKSDRQDYYDFLDKLNNIDERLKEVEELIKIGNYDGAVNKLKSISKDLEDAEKNLENLDTKEVKGIKIPEEEKEAIKVSLYSFKEYLTIVAEEIEENAKFAREFKGVVTIDQLDEILQKNLIFSTKIPTEKIVKERGFIIEGDKLVLDYTQIDLDKNTFARDLKTAIEARNELVGEKLKIYDDFVIEYDDAGNVVKIIYDPENPESFTSVLKEYFVGYPKRFLSYLSSTLNFIHDKMIDGEIVKDVLKELEDEISRDPKLAEKFVKAFKKYGIEDETQLLLMIRNTIRKYESGENLVLVVDKYSLLGKKLSELSDDQINPQTIKQIFREVLHEGIDKGDKKEIERLYGLLRGKTLRLKEDIAEFMTENPIGYAALRVIDLYTPLGVSYWDKVFSYYGYEGQKLPQGCQPSCEEGKVCVQLGACVRQFDLPKSCQNLGIDGIKLDRPSIIAANPRFYLVSPCYAKLQIYVNQNDGNVYIKPLLDRTQQPNYCYASEGFINAYITSLISEYVINILTTIFTGPLASWAINIVFTLWRETTFIWPYVYQYYPIFVSFFN